MSFINCKIVKNEYVQNDIIEMKQYFEIENMNLLMENLILQMNLLNINE